MSNQRLPPIAWLRAFDAAARHLSFTLAGQEINLTQSAVSQHVRNLEKFLGRDLFIRKTRALALTEDGANYLPVVREAFEVLARGTEAFVGGGGGRSLTLQCNMAFSVFWLTPRLPRLYERNPWLTLNIVTPIWDPERHADAASLEIRFGRAADVSPSAIRLTKETYFPVCRADARADAASLPRARLFDCAGVSGNWSSWFASSGTAFDRAGDVNLCSTFVISINAAAAGAGFALGHTTLVQGLLSEGRLIAPFEHEADLAEAYFLLPPAPHEESPATRALIDWLGEELTRTAEV